MKEMTLKDIEIAMKYLDDNAVYKIYADEYQIIETKNGFPYKIQLKPKGLEIIRSLI